MNYYKSEAIIYTSIAIMSIDLTNRGFIKDVFVIVTVVILYIVGALLMIDYLSH